jgi:hypothetical protein
MPIVAARANAGAFGLGWSALSEPPEELGGMVLLTPTSVSSTGTGNSASINANGSVAFSSCATLSLDGVFSVDYDNYMVTWGGTAGAGINIYLILRQSQTNNPNTSHYSQGLYSSSTYVTADRRTGSNGYFMFAGSPTKNGSISYIYGPHLAQATAHRAITVSSEADARTMEAAGVETSSTQWDGFSLSVTSTSFSGVISVYGLVGV